MSIPPKILLVKPPLPPRQTGTVHKLQPLSKARRLLVHAHHKLEIDSDRGMLSLRHIVGHISMWEATSEWIRMTYCERWAAENSERVLMGARTGTWTVREQETRVVYAVEEASDLDDVKGKMYYLEEERAVTIATVALAQRTVAKACRRSDDGEPKHIGSREDQQRMLEETAMIRVT